MTAGKIENIHLPISVFYGEYENEKKTGQKKFDPPRRGFEPQIFEPVPDHNLNFEGD